MRFALLAATCLGLVGCAALATTDEVHMGQIHTHCGYFDVDVEVRSDTLMVARCSSNGAVARFRRLSAACSWELDMYPHFHRGPWPVTTGH